MPQEKQTERKTIHRRGRWNPFQGQCETCGDYLYYEPGHKESFDQPGSKPGYYCETCDEWTE